jgi:hypothetical protein
MKEKKNIHLLSCTIQNIRGWATKNLRVLQDLGPIANQSDLLGVGIEEHRYKLQMRDIA